MLPPVQHVLRNATKTHNDRKAQCDICHLVEGGHDGVTGGVHGLTVKVSAGLPGDQDGGLPHEGENILEALCISAPQSTH
jgi:hypothetical protein